MPSMTMLPASGRITLANMRMAVVLPAPSGPTSPKISPGRTEKLKLSTAVIAPKRLVSPLTSTAAPAEPFIALPARPA